MESTRCYMTRKLFRKGILVVLIPPGHDCCILRRNTTMGGDEGREISLASPAVADPFQLSFLSRSRADCKARTAPFHWLPVYPQS